MAYSVEWDAEGYEVHTGPLDKGGEVYVANSPCAMLGALANDQGVVENQRGLIDQVTADCAVWRQTNPEPAPQQIAPTTNVSQAPPVENPPPLAEDTPAMQGAPEVDATASVEARPSLGSV